MRFEDIIKTQSVDDQAFIRRSLIEHECTVCHTRTLCAYDILKDAFFCSQDCHDELRPHPEQPIVEPDPPVVEHHEAEKKNGRSKKA
jgi:hypothetical protein